MKPLLTVVIPVYNVEKYLKRCIESILIQEWKNYDGTVLTAPVNEVEVALYRDGTVFEKKNITHHLYPTSTLLQPFANKPPKIG